MTVQAADPASLTNAFGKSLDPAFAARLAGIFHSPVVSAATDRLTLADGSSIPVVNGVPRFVASDQYVRSFSFQWTLYKSAQHDAPNNSDFSKTDFISKTGLTPEDVRGKLVLDAGCGSGRLLELLAEWGAWVIGADLSLSVDVAHHCLLGHDRSIVLQADIGNLPFRPETFDFVVSCGVLHHTPDTREYAGRLVPLVRPGGELAIWVYGPHLAKRQHWIPLTSRLPHKAFNEWCHWITGLARTWPDNHLLEILYRQMPFTFRHETHDRSALAMFDGYTPTYHGVHTEEEMMEWFRDFGLVDMRSSRLQSSMRGRKPDTA
ncbi:class I SAM-dependent methyltransferase [Ferrovibrio sp.]|uniref:class I SAM-dependent methyltransferase n=1 Tax=Ferrovibrio sp. TaxID=1917215 RepID=UPI003511E8B1